MTWNVISNTMSVERNFLAMRGTLRTSDEAGVSGVLPPLLFRWREGFGKF